MLTPKEYILAGHSTFSLKSNKTGRSFTYKVVLGGYPNWYIVSLITSGNRNVHFFYIGLIIEGYYHHSRYSTISRMEQSARGFNWFWKYIDQDDLPVGFIPSLYCCRCNAKLVGINDKANGVCSAICKEG